MAYEISRLAEPLSFGEPQLGLLALRLGDFPILDVQGAHQPPVSDSLRAGR
jgi:hypothetical protein